LAQFRRREAIPLLVSALGNELPRVRASAENALRAFGEAAQPALIEAAGTPEPSANEESRPSLLRRRIAVGILADGAVPASDWPKLRSLLCESDDEIAIPAARIALEIGPGEDHVRAVKRMFDALERADWFIKIDIEKCLVQHFDELEEQIEAEIDRRETALTGEQPTRDPVLSVLGRIERHRMNARTRHAA
jgi:HEAT repeat protein